MGILPQSRIQLYLDASRAGDLQSAYDLLHARSAQDSAGGGKRRTEDGFAGSALLQHSFSPAATATVDLTADPTAD